MVFIYHYPAGDAGTPCAVRRGIQSTTYLIKFLFIIVFVFFIGLVYNGFEFIGIWIRALEKPNYFGANAS